jgi:predicted esterase
VRTHFNVDPRRVVVGGYSSGSTLAGRVALENAELFAGLFVIPGRPWWSDDQRAELMSGAAWKLNIAWRAHTGDEYYPISALRADRRALTNAGWPLAFSEVGGGHGYTQDDFAYVFAELVDWVAP